MRRSFFFADPPLEGEENGIVYRNGRFEDDYIEPGTLRTTHVSFVPKSKSSQTDANVSGNPRQATLRAKPRVRNRKPKSQL